MGDRGNYRSIHVIVYPVGEAKGRWQMVWVRQGCGIWGVTIHGPGADRPSAFNFIGDDGDVDAWVSWFTGCVSTQQEVKVERSYDWE